MRHAVFQKPHCNKKVKLLLLHERYHYRLLSMETVFGLIKYLIRVRLEHICGYLFTAVSRQAMLNHTTGNVFADDLQPLFATASSSLLT